MKIGIISDTHGDVGGWETAWNVALSDADIIFHCGDVLYHGPKFKPTEGYDPKALAQELNDLRKPILIARGNSDSDVDQMVLDVPLQTPYLFAQIEGTRFLCTHGHIMAPQQMEPLCDNWEIDYLLCGHTHVPLVSKRNDTIHINPGTPTYPLHPDEDQRHLTCAVIEDDEPRLIDLETGADLEGEWGAGAP